MSDKLTICRYVAAFGGSPTASLVPKTVPGQVYGSCLLLLVCMIALPGCRTPILRAYSGPRQELNDLAVIMVSSSPPNAVKIVKIDEKPINYRHVEGPYSVEVHLLPGSHKLTMACLYRLGDYIYETETFSIEENFAASTVYQLRFSSDHVGWVFVEILELGPSNRLGPLLAEMKNAPLHWRRCSSEPPQATEQEEPTDLLRQANIQFGYGFYAAMINEFETAAAHFGEALAAYSRLNDTSWKQAVCNGNIGYCLMAIGRPAQAAHRFKRALEMTQGMQSESRLRAHWTKWLGQSLRQVPGRELEGETLVTRSAEMLSSSGDRDDSDETENDTLSSLLGTDGGFLHETFGYRFLQSFKIPLTKRFAPPPYYPPYQPYIPPPYIPPYIPPPYIPPPYIPPPYIPPPYIP